MPAGIVERLADAERCLAQVRSHLGTMTAVDQHFQGHAQFTAIVEDRAVLAGNTRRPGVEILVRVKPHRLRATVLIVHAVAVAQGPGTATHALAGLQHLHTEAGARQLQRSDQPGNSGAQHQYTGALPQAVLEFQWLRSTV